MAYQEDLYDLFFEISSLERHKILLSLGEKKSNLTQLAKKAGLNLPETKRHISRLVKVDLAKRLPDGSYSLTTFGQHILETVEEIAFFSQYREYFLAHSVTQIPREYQVKLSNIAKSDYHDNILNFIRRMESVINEAEERVLLLVDQFPLNHFPVIMESIEKGVNFKIIEPRDRVLNPDLDALAPQDSVTLDRIKITPLVEQRMMDDVNIIMVVSEKDAVIAFPTIKGEYDYKGFRAKDTSALDWCEDLFQHYWTQSFPRSSAHAIIERIERPIGESGKTTGKIVLTGRESPEYDVSAIQDAVDRYDEVVLKGRFNLSTSTIIIKKSLILRGEGRTNDIPDTKIYKHGWDFPFISQEFLLRVNGDNIDVSIENIHIENFNGTCIGSRQGNSLSIKKNRITLNSGLGRGLSMGKWGDHVVGITAGGDSLVGGFPDGILIEDNYLDFAVSYIRGGFITKDGKELDPRYRPDLQNHEAPICVGMNICRNVGKVIVRNNVVRNMNARGILVFDNWETAHIQIHDNLISSKVFGAYPYNNPMAGVGMFVMGAWTEPRKGGRVEMFNNKIILDKVNYCGIAVHGPAMYAEGAGKLEECTIENNEITLNDGLYGIQVRKSDDVEITGNTISGRAYYGLQLNGNRPRENIELGSNNILFTDNNLDGLEIKPPDDYSNLHVGDYVFNGVESKSNTAHVWLNRYSNKNIIEISSGESFIDQGKENRVTVSPE
jgi:predicted transcriptional regulator